MSDTPANPELETIMTANRIDPTMSSEETAWAYAVEAQGFAGDFAAWLALDLDERAEYEAGAAGIPTG